MENKIGANIKTLREKMNFNQTSIANFLNVDQSLISKAEKGERNLSLDMLEKLACLFGVTINEIENEDIEMTKLSFAFRTNDLTVDDMETISAINRIALNLELMDNLEDEANK